MAINLICFKKKRNIITEIIQTEKSYVQDLKSCLEVFWCIQKCPVKENELINKINI